MLLNNYTTKQTKCHGSIKCSPQKSIRALLFLFVIFVLLSYFSVTNSHGASEVAAIKSLNIRPYKEAVLGFKSAVPANVSEHVIRRRGQLGQAGEELVLLIKSKDTDLVFTMGTDALNFAKDKFTDMPIVFTFVLNPEGVVGKGQSGGNSHFHGISMNVPPGEQFKILKQISPDAKKIGVVYDPSKSQELINKATVAAEKLGITLVAVEVSTGPQSIDAITLMESRVDALWMVPDTTAITPASIEYMRLFSLQNSIPIIGISEKYVKNGALFSLSFDSEDMGRQAGTIARNILRNKRRNGKKLSLYTPRTFKLSINKRRAKDMGLSIPSGLLKSADSVY